MNKWDDRFVHLTKEIAKWSSCLNRQVGAIIVKNNRIMATGYNGAPHDIDSCVERGQCLRIEQNVESGTKQEICYAVHAEQNAILQAARLGIKIEDSTLYCTTCPCTICAKMIINAGIKKVIYLEDYPDEFAKTLLDTAHVELMKYQTTTELADVDLFLKLEEYIPGITDSLEQLGFFEAPCSTKYHLSRKGGLSIHSCNVARKLIEYTTNEHLVWEKERSPLLIGLLHDLCKCDQYIVNDLTIQWNKEADPRHGVKSAEIAKMLVPDLTMEEFMCIKYHMGAFVDQKEWTDVSRAMKKTPNIMWTHLADVYSTNCLEE